MRERALHSTLHAAAEAPSCPEPAQRAEYELIRCPVCGSGDSVRVAGAKAMARENELLRAFHRERLRPGVPIERLTDRLTFSQCPPISLTQCRRCSHVYRNPCERRESLEAAYRDTRVDPDVLRRLFQTQRETCRRQAARLSTVAGRAGRGLEVGSFAGGFLAAAVETGWAFEGVDINREAVAFARERGFCTTEGDLDHLPEQPAFDAIVIWNTFEQLPDVGTALAGIRRRLRERGVFALRVPNGEFYLTWRRRLRGPLGRLAAMLLAHNNLLRFPYRQAFTERSLSTLLGRYGFHVVRTFGDTLVPIADEWTTAYGRLEERLIKAALRSTHRGWRSPWVEVYARR